MIAIIIALIIHETGHLIAAIILNIKLKKLKITMFGFNMNVELDNIGFVKKFGLFFSGPLFNMIMFVVLRALKYNDFAQVNKFLACVNLIPLVPLDGGNICKSVLECCIDKNEAAKYIVKTNVFFIAFFAVNLLLNFDIVYLLLSAMAINGIREENKSMLEKSIKTNYYKTFKKNKFTDRNKKSI